MLVMLSDQEKIKLFEKAVKFQLEGLIFLVVKARKNGACSWAIEDMANRKILNSNMEWETEPPLAKRDQSYLIRTRFEFETALTMFEQYKMFAQ